MNRTDLWKLIEVCRSEADLQLPEFRELAEQIAADPSVRLRWERSQQVDDAIRNAVRDVSVPAGLEDRILNRLAAASSPAVVPDQEPEHRQIEAQQTGTLQTGAQHTGSQQTGVAGETRLASDVREASGMGSVTAAGPANVWRWRRRVAAMATVAILLVLVGVWWRPAPPSQRGERELAQHWLEGVNESRWQDANFPAQAYPPPVELTARLVRWQPVPRAHGSWQVVCYELASAGGRALLFVARGDASPTLSKTPPRDPAWSISPWSLAMWQGRDAVYVLAVQGGSGTFQRVLRVGPRQITRVQFHRSCPTGKV
jgi:hypothetical protein